MRAEPRLRHQRGQFFPERPGSLRERHLGSGRPSAYPDEPEVADTRPARSCFPLEMHDVDPAAASLDSVHRADDAAADNDNSFQRAELLPRTTADSRFSRDTPSVNRAPVTE